MSRILSLTCVAVLAAALPAGPAAAQMVQLGFGENVATEGDVTGYSVAALGDVDGDGNDDLAVGAPWDDDGGADGGTLYVVDGRYGTILHEIHGAAGENLGLAVADAGDVDEDGVDDVIAGAPGLDAIFPLFLADVGAFRVYSGATGNYLFGASGPGAGARLGEAVAGVGDTNADGVPDVLAGAAHYDGGRGYATLYSGKTHGPLNSWIGNAPGDMFGAAVSAAGDLEGDGRANYAMGSPRNDYGFPLIVTDAGRVDVYNGLGAPTFSVEGAVATEGLGSSLAGVGDTDGDGMPELLVGRPGANSGAGAASLFEGKAGTLVRQYAGLAYTAADHFGTSVTSVGDVNKDGFGDVAVGAPTLGSGYGGYVETFSGKDGSQYLLPIWGGYPDVAMGLSISGGRDLNDDGWPELVASFPYADTEGTDSGVALVFNYLHFQPSLGFQGPGIATLDVYGTELFAGGVADMRLQYATVNSPAWLLASVSQQFTFFKGGILVPSVAAGALLPFTTDAFGRVQLPGIPGGGGLVIVFCQFLVKNVAYPQGWGLSNAVAVEILP